MVGLGDGEGAAAVGTAVGAGAARHASTASVAVALANKAPSPQSRPALWEAPRHRKTPSPTPPPGRCRRPSRWLYCLRRTPSVDVQVVLEGAVGERRRIDLVKGRRSTRIAHVGRSVAR